LRKGIEQANREFHDQIAGRYDDTTAPIDEGFLQCLYGLAPKNIRLLDIGTGTGKILNLVHSHYQEAIGVDISFGMLDLAHRYSQVLQASCFQLPFAGDTFGVVTAYSVLHHLYRWDQGLQEAYRVLAPGGWLITDNDSNARFHSWFGWWLKFRRAFLGRRKKTLSTSERALEKLSEYHHSRGLEARAIKYVLATIGFKDIQVEGHHPSLPDTFTKVLMLLETMGLKTPRYYMRIKARKP